MEHSHSERLPLNDTVGNREVVSLVTPTLHYLTKPIRLVKGYEPANLRADLMAGLTVAVILLPQAIAFAIIADLPPQMGLYTAIVASIAAALWGSSDQMLTGPTNALSLLVLSSLQGLGLSDTGEVMVAAGLIAVMVGIFQLTMGLARLGILINFVSHSVIVGFATGAGVLILVKQIKPLLGLSFVSRDILETVLGAVANLPSTHVYTAALGLGTIAFVLILRRINRKLPTAILSMIVTSIVVFAAGLNQSGVDVIGELPSGLPPIAHLPFLNLELVGRLSIGALAIGAIGLVQTTAIARSVSAQTGQRLGTNQEFVGQGIANILSGLFSGYPASGSFSVSAVNFRAGARTSLAAIFSSVFVMIAMLTIGNLTAYLPRAALAGVLIITAYRMIDRAEIARIWRGTRGDAAIMLLTFVGTLLLEIEFAVLIGIMASFARYIMRASMPRVQEVVPDDSFRTFVPQEKKDACPQLGVIDIQGDLYFGAVHQVEEALSALSQDHLEQRFLLLRMHRVNHCDFSGIRMLEEVVTGMRERGGDVYLAQTRLAVRQVMASTGFEEFLGADHFLTGETAVSQLFHHVLDPSICIYECPLRVFQECQNLPKRTSFIGVPDIVATSAAGAFELTPDRLAQRLRSDAEASRPFVADLREAREYRRGHIAGALSIPLSRLIRDAVRLPTDREIILVCQSGQRSQRASQALVNVGCVNTRVLQGGMHAWRAAGLAVDVTYGI